MTTEAVPLQERVAALEELQNHLATKDDLEKLRGDMQTNMERLRGDMQADMERLRGDMERLRGDMQADTERLRGDMERLRGDMQADRERLRAELLVAIERAQTNTIRWMIGTIIAAAGLAVSITLAVEKLF